MNSNILFTQPLQNLTSYVTTVPFSKQEINRVLLSNTQPLFKFCHVLLMYIFCSGSNSISHIVFSFHSSLVFNLAPVQSFLCCFYFCFCLCFDFLNSAGQLFCRMLLNFACLMLPHDYIQVTLFWQEYYRGDIRAHFSASYQEEHN